MPIEDDLMNLRQVNFRIPRLYIRRLKDIAEKENKTLEGLLQDAVDRVIDEHLDELEAKARLLLEQVSHRRVTAKYAKRGSNGQ